MTVAKSMAGGLPDGRLPDRPARRHAAARCSHGSTFGGNPLAARRRARHADRDDKPVPDPDLGETLVQRAARSGDRLLDGLRRSTRR